MKVGLLQVTIYQDDGWTWRTERFRNPRWDDIDAAIRRLDRFHYPFVWLFRDADIEEDALPEFSVMGGKGEFYMDSYADGFGYHYCDPSRGDDLIEIWESDQGYTPEKKYCCPSLDIVLRVTHYFAEHGALDPSVLWQPC
jgi:hypothetical protein